MSSNETAKRAKNASQYRARGCHDRGLTTKEMAMFVFIENWFAVHASNRKRKSAKGGGHDRSA